MEAEAAGGGGVDDSVTDVESGKSGKIFKSTKSSKSTKSTKTAKGDDRRLHRTIA